MGIRIIFTVFCIVFNTTLDIYAQTVKFSGIVKSNNISVPYTTIYFPQYNTSTLCNEQGIFEISIENVKYPVLLKIQNIAYETLEKSINDNKNLEINIIPKVYTIQEAAVSLNSNKNIVLKAFEYLGNNTYSEGFNYSVFYRKNQTSNEGSFLYSTEYVSDVYMLKGEIPGVLNHKTRLKIAKPELEQKAIDQGNWEVLWNMVVDYYAAEKKKPRIAWIYKNEIDDYEFNYGGEITHNGEVYTKILFDNSNSNAETKQKGFLLINNSDYGILYINLDRKFKDNLISTYNIEYQKLNNKYFLHHINSKKQNSDKTNNTYVLMVNSIDTINVRKINNSGKSVLNSSLQNVKNFENDSVYWGKFKYLPNINFK